MFFQGLKVSKKFYFSKYIETSHSYSESSGFSSGDFLNTRLSEISFGFSISHPFALQFLCSCHAYHQTSLLL